MKLFTKRLPRERLVEDDSPPLRQYRKLISGGLAGFSGVCVSQLIGVGHRDSALTFSLYAFAVAIPLLVRDLMDAQLEERRRVTVDFDSRFNATICGATAAALGIGGVFWHFSEWIGLVFSAVCFYSIITHSSYAERTWEADKILELKDAEEKKIEPEKTEAEHRKGR